jgi:hypothetical protein
MHFYIKPYSPKIVEIGVFCNHKKLSSPPSLNKAEIRTMDLANDAFVGGTSEEGALDANKLEKAFLCRHMDADGSGEGCNGLVTRFNPRKFSLQDAAALQFIEPLKAPLAWYPHPGGDSEIEGSSSIYTDDGIKVGESATDWKNVKFRDVSTVASFSQLPEAEDIDLDKDFQAPVISRAIQFFDPLTVGEWADQLPSIPRKILWPFNGWTEALVSILLGGASLAFIYRLVRHRC